MSKAVVHSSVLHMLPSHLEKYGLQAEFLYRQAGLGAEHIASSGIVRRAQVHTVLGLAARATGEAEIGLQLGTIAEAGKVGPTALAILAGQTLESSLLGHFALMPRLQTECELGLWKEGKQAITGFRLIGDDATSWLFYEAETAFKIQLIQQVLGSNWAPDLITFPHAIKGRQSHYETFFNAPVRFGVHAESRIYFPSDWLKATRKGPIATEAAVRAEELAPIGRFCRNRLAAFSFDADAITAAIKNMLEASLPFQALTLANAAARLGLSVRTLQRRLDEKGWFFESMVDDLRHRMAIERLADLKLPITEIAMSLGYSDAAHFNRAFRRWEDCSPTDYRKRLSGSA